MNFMKKILVQTNSNTSPTTGSSINQQNAMLNQTRSNEPNQQINQTNQTQPSTQSEPAPQSQQIELDSQLESLKSRMSRTQRSDQLESSQTNDLHKQKARGLSLASGDKHNTQDIGLALLNKLFLNIKTEHNKLIEQYGQKGPSKYDQNGLRCKQELEKNIYKLLPLFMKTFNCSMNETMPEMRLSMSMQSFNLGNSGVSAGGNKNAIKNVDLFEQFHDLPTFATIISRLMVTEIRKRASQKTTQDASQSVVKFLELSPNVNKQFDKLDPLESIEEDENNNNGWILLSTLNFLVCNCSSNLIPVMAAVNLPSTLTKCLYLFFDLPELQCTSSQSNESNDQENSEQQFKNLYSNQLTSSISLSKITMEDIQSDLDRRLLLKKVFSQLLSRLR